MAKAQLVTRATTSGTNTENLNKGSALTHAEMDKNLIGLRDASFGIADDSSTVLQVTDDKTITIAGGTGITTALSGDTLTITNSGGDITSVVAGDGLANGGTTGDVTLNIGAGTGIDVAADAIAVDVSDFMTNGSDNRVVTATGTDAMNAEANLTFDGSTLAVTGNITATTSIANDGVIIDDNTIKTSRSNDDLLLQANGTDRINIMEPLESNTRWTSDDGNTARIKSFAVSKANLSVDADTTDREYGSAFHYETKLSNGSTSNSNFRPRTLNILGSIDMDGNDYTRSGASRGPAALYAQTRALNSSSSSAANLQTLVNINAGSGISDFDNPAQNLTVEDARAVYAAPFVEGNGNGALSITNGYAFYAEGYIDKGGSGAGTMDNYYAFYAGAAPGTNNYAFYSDSDTAESALGTIERYRETINALTNSATITVDCRLAPVHTVTLAQTGTQFNFKNLGTGQTATVVVKQDSNGSRTATFTEEDSSAILFQGGPPTLSTAANAVDVITVFNTGSEVLGNCAKAYSAS